MPENRSRFVLLCQQSLAFGLVAAVAAPAANMVTLDIVAPPPAHGPVVGSQPGTDTSVGLPSSDGRSVVASRPIEPRVTDVPLSGVTQKGLQVLDQDRSAGPTGQDAALRLAATEGDPETDDLAVLSAPQPVDSLATVGVTWAHGAQLPEDAITVSVRTEQDGVWSEWLPMPYHDEHGPDLSSDEGRHDRPGTDPVYVGNVDDVQVKAQTATGEAPKGMTLSLVDPGSQTAPEVEEPAIDTGTLGLSAAATTDETGADDGSGTEPVETPVDEPVDPVDPVEPDEATLSAGGVTAKPQIYSRAQWGADERMRDKGSLKYGEVHAGFVHHTVNANNYTQAQVPSILRGIYAYHTQSRGWSDVGYNFLVDRFGRIWEGRYGGVDRPVVGAHTLGYNDDAFAMSAIGNFETAQPSAALLDAYGRLMAWKLNLHGISASSAKQWVTKKYFQAINGHRDAGQTACPGRYLYAKLGTIRSLAVKYQKSFAGRNRLANLSGSAWPDIVVRDKATKTGYVLRTGGQVGFSGGTVASSGWSGMDKVVPVGDVTGDGKSDVLGRNRSTGSTAVYPGDGAGRYGAATKPSARFAKLDQLTGVGDWNGDGRNDVVGRNGVSKRLYVYFGNGTGTFGASYRQLSTNWGAYRIVTGAGDLTGDRRPDLVGRTADGRLWLAPGTGTGIAKVRLLSSGWSGYDVVTGLGDVTNDGRPDLVARYGKTRMTWIYPGDGRGGLGARLGPYSTFTGVNLLLSAGQVTGSAGGDMVGRDSAGRMLVFRNTGARNLEAVASMGRTFPSANLMLNVGDWNGDGKGDVMTRATSGVLYLLLGKGTGAFGDPIRVATGFGAVRLLTAVGDLTGDGYPDLMGQPSGGSMRIYPSNGSTGLRASYVSHSAISATQQAGIGLWNGDGSPDSLFRRSDGNLVLYPGNGPGGLTGGSVIGSVSSGYDWVLAAGDTNGDRRPDLIVREAKTGRLWLRPGTSTGFGDRRLLVENVGRFDLAG